MLSLIVAQLTCCQILTIQGDKDQFSHAGISALGVKQKHDAKKVFLIIIFKVHMMLTYFLSLCCVFPP